MTPLCTTGDEGVGCRVDSRRRQAVVIRAVVAGHPAVVSSLRLRQRFVLQAAADETRRHVLGGLGAHTSWDPGAMPCVDEAAAFRDPRRGVTDNSE